MEVKLGDLARSFTLSPRLRPMHIGKKPPVNFDVALACVEPHITSKAPMVYHCQAKNAANHGLTFFC
jgi:hypothetical protein